MKGNKKAHNSQKSIRKLLVMVVIFMVIVGASTGESLVSWQFRSLQTAQASSIETVLVKNKLPVVVTQDVSPTKLIPIPENTKTVYITFDDGPSANTAKVLDILGQEGVRATFFVLGNQAKSRPELINSIWEQGHAIGNHTYNHNYHDLYSGFTEFWSQIKQTEEIVRGITGVRPQLIRAPGGTFGHFDHTYFQLLKQAGYEVLDWTVDSGDSKRRGVPASEIVKASTVDLKSSKVVLLLHDGAGHEESVKALRDIISRYKAAGYVFDALDERVEPVQFRVSTKASTLERAKPSAAWVASNISPNAELFAPGKPLVLEVGKLETKLDPGEYSIQKGQYMVPLRAVIERLGGKVSWDAMNRSGKVSWNGKDFVVDVENEELMLKLPNGTQNKIEARVEMIGGSIWVSLRELFETANHPPVKISVTEVERRVKAS